MIQYWVLYDSLTITSSKIALIFGYTALNLAFRIIFWVQISCFQREITNISCLCCWYISFSWLWRWSFLFPMWSSTFALFNFESLLLLFVLFLLCFLVMCLITYFLIIFFLFTLLIFNLSLSPCIFLFSLFPIFLLKCFGSLFRNRLKLRANHLFIKLKNCFFIV